MYIDIVKINEVLQEFMQTSNQYPIHTKEQIDCNIIY